MKYTHKAPFDKGYNGMVSAVEHPEMMGMEFGVVKMAAGDVMHFDYAQSEAEQMRSEYTERLSKAKEEAAEIVGSATRRAAERSDEILRESSQQASAMVKKAERVIEQERIKAHKELKDEVADLSVMIASKIVERDVKPEDHERFIEDFIDKVG